MLGNIQRMFGVVLLLAASGLVAWVGYAQDAKTKSGVPTFRAEESWAKVPGDLKLGMLVGIAVDAHDHVWVFHRPNTVKGAQAAPPVIEFDAAGNYIQGWGGPGEGYEWPLDNHGIFVDYQDHVWLCAGGGDNRDESQILKFTNTGKFLLQIGHRGQSKGSNDVENFGRAADVYVYPKTNEVFVADGYLNRRVIVFDATTGAFKRYWGAYGNKPDDSSERGKDIQQFGIVHDVRVSNDGLVYVADRQDGRVQVFTLDGKYLKEVFLDKDTKEGTGVASIAFSRDGQQQFIYVADLSKGVVHILNRQTLETVGTIGHTGEHDGKFDHPHNIAADSKGNLYAAELGERIRDGWFGAVRKFHLEGPSIP